MKSYQKVNLFSYNTFAIDLLCDRLIEVEKEEEVLQLLDNKIFESEFLVIGGGSNLLFTKPFNGTIIKMVTKGIKKVKEDDFSVWIEVQAGELWEDFIFYCIDNQYYGIENLVGIPGLVGSSPVQNIGAYSVEAKDVIEMVSGWRISTQKSFQLSNDECQFGYRNSIFKSEWKNDVIITKVLFRLSKKEKYVISYQGLIEELGKNPAPLSLRKVADAILALRNTKLPDISEFGCAGSFFKNPIVSDDVFLAIQQRFPKLISYPVSDGKVKLAAGQLIDLAGMKGYREGNVGVWPKQALVIVNYGGASGEEIVAFYKKVQQCVFDTFGIAIEPEVNVI